MKRAVVRTCGIVMTVTATVMIVPLRLSGAQAVNCLQKAEKGLSAASAVLGKSKENDMTKFFGLSLHGTSKIGNYIGKFS